MNQNGFRKLMGALDNDLTLFDGYVQLDSSGAVVDDSDIKGVTVTKTGTGEYTFTFDRPGNKVKFADVTFVAGTASDKVAQVKSFSRTEVVVNLCAGATPTNPNAACGLFFFAAVRHSALTR